MGLTMRRVVVVLSTCVWLAACDEGEEVCTKPPCSSAGNGSGSGGTQSASGGSAEAGEAGSTAEAGASRGGSKYTGSVDMGGAGAGGMEPAPTPPSWLIYTARDDASALSLFASPLDTEAAAEPAEPGAKPAPLQLSASYGANESLSVFEVSRSGERVVYRLRGATAYDRDLFVVDLNGGQPTTPVRINSPLPVDGLIGGAWLSDDGQRIAYLAKDSLEVGFDLFAVDLSGVTPSVPLRINERTDDLESVSVSASAPWLGGSLLYTLTADIEAPDEQSELYLADVATWPPTTPAVKLSSDDGTGITLPWLSPDRSRLVYARESASEAVHAFFIDGLPGAATAAKPLVGDFLAPITLFRAIWAPDNLQLVYEADGATAGTTELFRLTPSAETLAAQRLNLDLPAGGQVFGSEAWSPDSRKVVFAADQEEQGKFQLLLADVSGAEPAAPLTVSERIQPGQSLCTWSPDNRWVVFTSDLVTPSTLELFAFDTALAEGATPVRINTALAAQNHAVLNVAFAPRGARLYYSAEQTSPGAYDLFTVDLSGAAPSAPQRVNTSTAADRSAIVSSLGRDGSLFFLESGGGAQNLYFVADPAGESVLINAATQKVSTFALAYP